MLEVPDSGLTVALLTGLTLDEYLIRTDAAGLQGLIVDALGSTIALTDAGGAAVASYSYEPFGRSEVAGSSSANVFQYTGRENDGTGLYYYRARYYHPGLQRFISEDPIGFLGQDVNLYAYVTNSPLRSRDPFGLLNFLAGVGGSAVGVTGVEGSGGIVFNPGGGSQPIDAGVFGSAGIGAGLNIGADAFVGFVAGGIENVSGKTVNTNFVFGPASLTIIGDPNTGKFIGFTFGVGPTVPIPFQASLTGAVTGTFTVRDLLRSLSPSKAEASMSPAAVPIFPSASPPSLAGRK